MNSRVDTALLHKRGIGARRNRYNPMPPTAFFMPPLCDARPGHLEFICGWHLHDGNHQQFLATDMGQAFSMNATARSEEFCGASTGRPFSQKLSVGPLAADIFPKPEHSAATPFSRPGPEILSEAIPVFFIGRNQEGFWVARDAEGKVGGLFWRKQAALRFARRSAGPIGCAAVFPHGGLELDVENTGNPLVTPIAAVKRLIARAAVEMAAATLRRPCRSAFSILLIMLALAVIIALEAAFYVPRGGH